MISKEALLGKRGAAIKYESGIKVYKKIWCSDEFQSRHAAFYNIVRKACAAPGTKWSLIGTQQEWEATYHKEQKSHRKIERKECGY